MPWKERDHTADWSIWVGAEDYSRLLVEAARGMYALMHLELDEASTVTREFEIDGIDRETQLVTFLDELLFCIGHHREAYDTFEIDVDGERVGARLEGREVTDQVKEIKAVTFHGLEVTRSEDGLEATIVFDV